jgi:hypothetical protein
LNLPDIFASIESPHRQTNKVKILAAVGLPRGRYLTFTVFTVYVGCPQLKISVEFIFLFFMMVG